MNLAFIKEEYYDDAKDGISSSSVKKPYTYLCMFLNYIFKDKVNSIKSLKELTYTDVDTFLNNIVMVILGKITGHIKVPRDQCVYYSFLPILDRFNQEHLQFLKEKGYDKDEYGALFFNQRGIAMKE